MGRGPFSEDAFSRGGAPSAGLHAPVRDKFKEKAEKLAARKGGKPAGDAFASTVRPVTKKKDAFRALAESPQPAAKEAAFRPEPLPRRTRTLANGAALEIVASQPLVLKTETLKRDEKRGERRAAKSSSFVLVSSSNVVEAPAPAAAAAGDGGQGPLVIPPLSSPKFRPKGGGGDGGSGGGAQPPRDRILNQDDLAGVLVVLAVLLLIALYLANLFKGGSAAPSDEEVLDIQSAAAESVAPPAPLPDPYGNKAFDLTPKSPVPPELAVVAAAPAPAAVAPDVRVQAYFCTDKSELTPASAEALDREIAAWGDRMAGKNLVVAGYADTRGEAVYNTWLGGERARAVVNYLTAKGFKATALAVGELPDLTDNENCANQRRVDVRLADAAEEAPSRSCAPPPEFAALACLAEPGRC